MSEEQNRGQIFRSEEVDFDTPVGSCSGLVQRAEFTCNVRGRNPRVLFSNRFGKRRLVIGWADFEVRNESGERRRVRLSYGQKERIVILPGESFYSDLIKEEAICFSPGDHIRIEFFFEFAEEITSGCQTWSGKSFSTIFYETDSQGNLKGKEKNSQEQFPYIAADINRCDLLVGLRAIEALFIDKPRKLAFFGDSITHMGYYTDACDVIFRERHAGEVIYSNHGLGGNRLLHNASYVVNQPGHGQVFGPAGIHRFASSVFGENWPDDVLILEGINDIMHPPYFGQLDTVVNTEELIDGMTCLVDIVKKNGARPWLSTVMPFVDESEISFREAEETRQKFNQWIRIQTISEGVLDFDVAMRREEDASRLKDGIHIGDGLHPNKKGGEIMAEIVEKTLWGG